MVSQRAISKVDNDHLCGLGVSLSGRWLCLSLRDWDWSMRGRNKEEPGRGCGEVGASDSRLVSPDGRGNGGRFLSGRNNVERKLRFFCRCSDILCLVISRIQGYLFTSMGEIGTASASAEFTKNRHT